MQKYVLLSFYITTFLFIPLFGATAGKLSADLVILNANVVTVCDKIPRAEAVAVKNGIIVAVGSNNEIRKMIDKDTKVIDVLGKTVTPGFIDAHCHPEPIYTYESLHYDLDLGPDNVKTIDELIQVLKKKAKITPKGQWVHGSGYQDTKLGEHPTRWDLDRASTEHPIYILHSSKHIGVVNSKALELLAIRKDTPDPPGGAFDKNEAGELTGVCRESAEEMVKELGPACHLPTKEEELEGIQRCFAEFVKKGITSIGDARVDPSKIELYQDAMGREMLYGVRIYLMIYDVYLDDILKLKLRTGFGGQRLKIGPIKIYHGNSLSGRTCWLSEPYEIVNPETGKKDYYGIPPERTQKELNELVFRVHEAGFQCAIHSNGDREITMVLDAYEKALKKLPRTDHRHRIEHCSVMTPAILEKIKDLGIVLALHSYIWEHGDKMEAYGEKRWDWMHPNRSAIEMGIPVAGNSDYSVSAADPMLRIQSMVTRMSAEGKIYGPKQRVEVEDAIRIWTLGSAYASFEENIKGSIEVGKLADLVVLSEDPLKVSNDTIKDIVVEATIIGGKVVYEKEHK